jgi:hypothetical protein
VATGRKGTVWVLRGDRRIERRDLLLGLVGAEATEVRSGNLQPGERLVTRVSERSR